MMAEGKARAAEAKARAADEAAQERGPATALPVGALAPGYVWCAAGMHPDHADAVVYPPGVLLPDWVVAAFAAQQPNPDEFGVYRLEQEAAS